jgi:hypothetical protein
MREGLASSAHSHPHTPIPRHPYQPDSFIRRRWEVRASRSRRARADSGVRSLQSPKHKGKPYGLGRSCDSTAITLHSPCTARTLFGGRDGGAHPCAHPRAFS